MKIQFTTSQFRLGFRGVYRDGVRQRTASHLSVTEAEVDLTADQYEKLDRLSKAGQEIRITIETGP